MNHEIVIDYQKNLKQNIQVLIENSRLEDAKELLNQYENIIKDDIEIYSMKSIIAMMEEKMDEAENFLLAGLNIRPLNFDLLYNIAYLYEIKQDYVKAYYYYKQILYSSNTEILNEVKAKIKDLEKMEEVKESNKRKAPAITIITWAYNAEKYIEECVESVLNQSFTDFEWVIIDNASTDKTGDIIKKYSERDYRIKIFTNKQNSFLRHSYEERDAINPKCTEYINNLKSEYVCQLDNDDFLHHDFLKALYCQAKRYNADLAIGGTEMFDDKNPNRRGRRTPPDFQTNNIFKVGDIFPQIYGSIRTIWGRLIKTPIYINGRKYVKENNINLLNANDTMLSLIHLKLSKSLVSVHKVLHYYRIREDSQYHSQVDKNRYLDYLKIYNESKKLLKSWNKLNDTNMRFIEQVLYYSMKDCMDIAAMTRNVKIEDRIKAITIILSDQDIRKILNENGLLINMFNDAIHALNTIAENYRKRMEPMN